MSPCTYTRRERTCARRTHARQRSRTSIGDHESTSEGKPSSGGWSGLAAFYHILLYMRERFFPPWHRRRLLSSLLRVRRGGWSLRISLGRDAARSISSPIRPPTCVSLQNSALIDSVFSDRQFPRSLPTISILQRTCQWMN